jgi:hypothetical protein
VKLKDSTLPRRTRISFAIPNTDETLLEVLDATKQYLAAHQDAFDEIEEQIWAYRSLLDLVPETVENLMSGHLFPLVEGEYELGSSIAFCRLGFYKHAIGALRNVLELGWLSVYWDLGGQSHVDIQGWLRSVETTPFRKRVFDKLKAHSNFQTFDEKHAKAPGRAMRYSVTLHIHVASVFRVGNLPVRTSIISTNARLKDGYHL